MADLRKITHLLALEAEGSFARAARKLGITQSALSRSIQSQEAEYGFRIFERGRGTIVPTAAGKALMPDAARLLQDAMALDRQAAGLGKAEAGSVTIGMGPLAAVAILPQLLALMLQERPGIRTHAVIDGGPDLVRRTLVDEIEFCCVADIMVPNSERVDALPIARLPLALIVRTGHPLLDGRGTLRDYPLIGGSAASRTPGPYQPTIRCDNNSVLKSVVLASDAIWLTATASAKAEMAAGFLTVLPDQFDSPEQEIRIVLVRHYGRTLSPAARYLEQTVRRLAADL
jgi:DNA-binding transcriptional LysR family regulator